MSEQQNIREVNFFNPLKEENIRKGMCAMYTGEDCDLEFQMETDVRTGDKSFTIRIDNALVGVSQDFAKITQQKDKLVSKYDLTRTTVFWKC